MVSAFGFHALLTRDLVRRRDDRTVKFTDRPAFFNPMWRFMTDRHPAGTYYLRDSRPINHFWHTPDQLLVRPAVMDTLEEVTVVDSDGTESLLDPANGWPDTVNGSDHLPLLFRLNW